MSHGLRQRSPEEMGEEGKRLLALGARLKLGEDYLEELDQDIIFRTPGLMPFDRHLEAARERGSLITSEMEVFFALCPCRSIAVTGSDGKTTTTSIIAELLKAGATGYTLAATSAIRCCARFRTRGKTMWQFWNSALSSFTA